MCTYREHHNWAVSLQRSEPSFKQKSHTASLLKKRIVHNWTANGVNAGADIAQWSADRELGMRGATSLPSLWHHASYAPTEWARECKKCG
jgi:hypothetical protein